MAKEESKQITSSGKKFIVSATCIDSRYPGISNPDFPVRFHAEGINGMFYQFPSEKDFQEWKKTQSQSLQDRL